MKTDVFKKSEWYWGTNLLSLASLQEECKLVSSVLISRGTGEGDWILGGSFRFNKQGWLLIKRGDAVQSLNGLDRATTSDTCAAFQCRAWRGGCLKVELRWCTEAGTTVSLGRGVAGRLLLVAG